MDNAIVDMVLGLVLLYLLLAILATKLQEYWDGQYRGGRVLVMHDMLLEAVGRNDELKKRILQSPAVFALYRGEDTAKPTGGLGIFLAAASGPSNLPADLFARTLLVELFDDGKGTHPSAKFSTPQAFLAEKAPAAAPVTDANRIWSTLRTLLAGREADWAAYEQAIARWFADIGDRADGWFQRRSAKISWCIALFLAVALNADSIYVAEQLSRNNELRTSLATIARRVDALFPGGQESSKEAAQAALKAIAPQEAPLARADRSLKDAISRVGRVFWRDDAVARTKLDQWRLELADQSNLSAPMQLVSSCALKAVSAGASDDKPGARTIKNGGPGGKNASAPVEFLSNPGTWLLVLPAVQSALHRIDVPLDAATSASAPKPHGAEKTSTSADDLRDCLSMLGSQIRSVGAMRGESEPAGADLIAAADAVDGAREAIAAHRAGQQVRLPVARLFQRDPELFSACADGRPGSQEALQRCIDAGSLGRIRLPVFFTGENRRQQFCKPATLNEVQTTGGWTNSFCSDVRMRPDPQLGYPDGLVLVLELSSWPLLLAGYLMTALFVALGAPFWFDVLGKVSKVRAAGDVRSPEATPPASSADKPPVKPADPGDGAEPFSLARNVVEKAMTPADIIALQRGLGVSASGVLDAPTRAAIADRATKEGLGTGDEVSVILFERVVGRSLSAVVVPRPDGSLVLHEPHPQASKLAQTLLPLLSFKLADRFPPTGVLPTGFDDDLRAMAVLYRYKCEAGTQASKRLAVTLANSNRAALDTLDLALATEMLDAAAHPPAGANFARQAPAAWLDWAIGELGQIERGESSPSKSNGRIVAYLTEAGLPGDGDRTPWCAAFVTWVLARARAESAASVPPGAPIPAAPGAPAASSSWLTWNPAGRRASFAAVQPGDVVCFKFDPAGPNPADHVAFVLEVDQAAQVFWALGGNQGGKGQVQVSRHAAAAALAWIAPV